MSETSQPHALFTLWYKPRQTLQGLIASGKGRLGAILIASLLGFVQAWPSFVSRPSYEPVLLIGAMLAGIAGLYLFSWLLRNFGRWFGAEAELADVRTALGWGVLPWTMLFAVLIVFITLRSAEAEKIYALFFLVLVYGFVILLSSLSAALRITYLKTFLCMVITFLVSVFPLTLIMQVMFGVPGANAP